MVDTFSLNTEELRTLQEILESYISGSPASRIHKLNLELRCIKEEMGYSLEDICYFAANDIDGSGNVTKFKKFLEDDSEVNLAIRCDAIIHSHVEDDESTVESLKPTVKDEPSPKHQTYSLDTLLQKLENSLRKVVTGIPAREFDIHDAIEQLLIGTEFEGKYTRDIETIPFSVTSAIPDFVFSEIHTALEVKFCNEKKDVKKISKEMAADISPYKKEFQNIVFLVYDMGQIQDINQFVDDFNSIEDVTVIVVKH